MPRPAGDEGREAGGAGGRAARASAPVSRGLRGGSSRSGVFELLFDTFPGKGLRTSPFMQRSVQRVYEPARLPIAATGAQASPAGRHGRDLQGSGRQATAQGEGRPWGPGWSLPGDAPGSRGPSQGPLVFSPSTSCEGTGRTQAPGSAPGTHEESAVGEEGARGQETGLGVPGSPG